MGLDYYTSERFIHEDLCAYTERAIPTLYESWKKYRQIEPFAITWPAETLVSSNGILVNDACIMQLQDVPRQNWNTDLLEAIQLSKAYAVLLVEQTPEDVLLILESKHGTKSWRLPIRKSGDVDFLGSPTTAVDKESLGYLWSPNLARA